MFFKAFIHRTTLFKAIVISFLVGLILNLVNQFDAIVSMDFQSISLSKVFITFLVPYLVSSYSIVSTKLSFLIGDVAVVDAHLECRHCHKNEINVKEKEIIPVCPKCLEHTDWGVKKSQA
ncbi:MAG: zinc ribbon-containing protein [Chlorobi bacterium]|nr:zinc ribbon-containing protein [Chlorobiota bacterium]